MKQIIADDITNNIRLDKYLIEQLELTRTKIQNLIKNEQVTVNGKKVKNSYIVLPNDIISIDLTDSRITNIEKENIPLDIIFEDNDIMVVNKPSGMVVHPANGNYTHTLVNALMYHADDLSAVNGIFRPGIVHRIDKDTSGLLLVAKNDQAHVALASQLKAKTTTRKYLALVSGVINHETGTIDAPIGRDLKNRKKMMVTDINSKNAITHFKVLERLNNATLILCQLETGRTHQIRVHLAYIGHPVINDPVYGYKVIDSSFGQLLHAMTIGFIHPKTNQYMEFEVMPPVRFNEIVNTFRL